MARAKAAKAAAPVSQPEKVAKRSTKESVPGPSSKQNSGTTTKATRARRQVVPPPTPRINKALTVASVSAPLVSPRPRSPVHAPISPASGPLISPTADTLVHASSLPTRLSTSPRPLAFSSATLVNESLKRKYNDTVSDDGIFTVTTLSDDEFEPAISFFSPRKSKIEQAEEDVIEASPRVKRPNELPDMVEIGDSCYWKSSNGLYEAGYLKAFQPTSIASTLGDRYVVMTIKNEEKRLRRGQVIFKMDKEFATCKLAGVHTTITEITCDAKDRETTPPPESDLSTFGRLSLSSQIQNIRPHLSRLIKDRYEPGRWRADTFYEGKSAQWLKQRALKGTLTDEEVSGVIIPELERWALRGEGPNNQVSLKDRSRPPRPTGSSRYEALDMKSRLRYVLDVLYPEALVHMTIIMNDMNGNEQADYDEATQILEEDSCSDTRTQWETRINDIRYTRERMREKMGLPSEQAPEWKKTEETAKKFDEGLETGQLTLMSSGRAAKKKSYKE